jgi:hypothetical protein
MGFGLGGNGIKDLKLGERQMGEIGFGLGENGIKDQYAELQKDGVFNGVREVPDLDGNLVEDVVVQGEVDAEELPRTRRPQVALLREGLGTRNDCCLRSVPNCLVSINSSTNIRRAFCIEYFNTK